LRPWTTQRRNVTVAARAVAELAADYRLVLTHGNGPREGMIGYLLDQALQNELPGRQVATLLTQVVVGLDDPAFTAPTKPVGPVYTEAETRRLAAERGWTIAVDGRWWRRVEAVIDKDLAAALLARQLHATFLHLLTNAPAILRGQAGTTVAPARS
jgi:carbamate kinase